MWQQRSGVVCAGKLPGIAGPVLGSLAALVVYFAADVLHSRMLLALAYSGLFLNLFNLIPVKPLDGGRISAIVSPRMWLLGIPVLVAVFLWRPSPLLLLIGVLALGEVWRSRRHPDTQPAAAALASRVGYGLFYFGLVVLLALQTFAVHNRLQSGI